MIFRTNKNAPNYRLISVDLEKPAEENWTTLLAEHEKDVLDWAHCVDKNKLVIGYLHDVKVFYLTKPCFFVLRIFIPFMAIECIASA